MRVALLALVVASSAFAQDADLDDARKFLAGRPEVASLVSKAADQESPGVYQLKLDAPAPATWVVKRGNAWAVVIGLDAQKTPLSALIPPEVLGGTKVSPAFVVVSDGAGSVPAGKSFPPLDFATGVTLTTKLEVGSDGTLGQLRSAGLLPQTPLSLTGSVGGALVQALMEGSAPQLSSLDYSLALSVPSMVPAPFTMLNSPKLTLGDTTVTFTKSAGAFSLSGEQRNSTLAFTGRTFTLPKTLLKFTANGSSYDVAVDGTSSGTDWKDAFSLQKVTVKSVSLRGTISAAKSDAKTKVKGFGLSLGAKVRVDRTEYDGEFTVDVENNALKELTLSLNGDLDLGFLPPLRGFTVKQVAIAFTPATMSAALAGRVTWRDFEGAGAVVLSGQPLVVVRLTNLDLARLAGGSVQGLPQLPPLDLVLAAGRGDGQALPGVVQDLIDQTTQAPGMKLTVGDGLSLLTRIDAQKLGGDAYDVRGPLVVTGSLDAKTGAFRLAAAMPKLPRIDALPRGFSIEAPELFVAASNKGGATVGSFGLSVRLLMPADGQVLAFKGAISASTAGSFAFSGALETNWVNPVGLSGLTIVAPVIVTVGATADGSVDLGFQAGLTIAKRSYAPMAMCLNLQAAAPAPVPKKVALRFKGSEFGPQAQLEVMGALVKAVANGPMKSSLTDPSAAKALAQVGPGIDHVTDSVGALNLPLLSFTDVDVALTTPGITCDLPAINGLGVKVSGGARFMNTALGTFESEVSLTQGLVLRTRPSDLQLANVLAVRKASIEVLAPMPGAPPDAKAVAEATARQKKLSTLRAKLAATNKALGKTKDADDKADLQDDKADLEGEISDLEQEATAASAGQFTIAGRVEVLRFQGDVTINVDRGGAGFDLSTDVADLGKLAFHAESEGDDLAHATDFTLGLDVSSSDNAKKALRNKLLAGLQATAQARKAAAAALGPGNSDAQKAAQAEFDRLDADVGADYRKAKKSLKSAKKKLDKADRAIDRAKRKCKKDLGPLWKLCDTMDAAKASLSAAKKTLSAAKDTVKGITEGRKYAQLQAAQGTLLALKAEKGLAEAGLAGWGAIDNVAKLAVNNSDLISVDDLDLTGSLKSRTGTLSFTASVGDADFDESFEVDLSGNAPLDVSAVANRLADEIARQAATEGSAVWKQLRKGKK